MSAAAIKGWCPDAWHPMMAGDGLLLRIRPRLGRMTAGQVLAMCEVALAHGNGQIDLTSRANLQLRGFDAGNWEAAIGQLVDLGLVDPDPVMETRRAVLVTPDWRTGDDTLRIAEALIARLDELPDLPGKMGFAIDAGDAPVLGEASADFRIERGQSGGLILRADGRETGAPVVADGAVDALITLAHWFIDTGGIAARRMARHNAELPNWATGSEAPAPAGAPLLPGEHALGPVYGLPFGRIDASALAAAMTATGAQAVRITPWRTILFEHGTEAPPLQGRGWGGASRPGPAPRATGRAWGEAPPPAPPLKGRGDATDFITAPADPAVRVDACPGAPACPAATTETRDLALQLAPLVSGRLHVSGCAKGCAHSGPADVVLTGRDGLFDLGFAARAGDPPAQSGLTPAQILAHFESRR